MSDEHEQERFDWLEWQCDGFAVAAHELSDLPIGVQLLGEDHSHCYVVLPNGQWLDADGPHDPPPDGHVVQTPVALRELLHSESPPPEMVEDAKDFILEDNELSAALGIQRATVRTANPMWWRGWETPPVIPDKIPTAELLDVFDEMIDVQCSNGNWNHDPYMHGMANGMIYMRSLVDGKDPPYLEAPEEWLADRNSHGQTEGEAYAAGFRSACTVLSEFADVRVAALGPLTFSRLSKLKSPEELLDEYDEQDLVAQFKFDGWKMMAEHAPDGMHFYSRRGKDMVENFPELAAELEEVLPVDSALLGEICAYDADGIQQISLVQGIAGSGPAVAAEKTRALEEDGGHLVYEAYDLLEYAGDVIADRPLIERDQMLRDVLPESDNVDIPENYPFADWENALEKSLAQGGEGLVFKALNKPYVYGEPGEHEHTGYFYKFKPSAKAHIDEVFVDSYTMGKEKAIFPAYQYDEDGEPFEVGKLSGLPRNIEADVMDRIDAGETVVVEVTYQERMPSGKLRHMGWSRLRPDKPLESVTIEREASLRRADAPKHPNTIIIEPNEYYEDGLTEQEIWEYYDEVKDDIIEQCRGRLTTIFVRVDGDIVQRNKGGEPIDIEDAADFDALNNGRTVEFHPEIAYEKRGKWWTDVLFVDLDPRDEFPWEDTKALARTTHDLLLEQPEIEDVTIKFSGGRGFHILGHLRKPMDPDDARNLMKELLRPLETEMVKLGVVHEDDQLRLDTTLMKRRGSLRAFWSLNDKTGLVAMPVGARDLDGFEKADAKVGKAHA